jgi:catalase
LKFPDLNHAVKRDPKTNMRSPNNQWDFWSSLPEALLQVTIIMSDRGIPASYRYMHGFSSHAYSFINENNERHWVKFHFRSQQGILNLTDQEAAEVVGADRESHQRDLFTAIANGKFPKWTMYVQIMSEEQADAMENNPFDLTKMWLKKDVPFIEVGEFELNRNPENYFADVEQAAFSPANVVPGISFSPDRMLQGRLFAYGDAQRYRLGINHHQIPVNTPKGAAEYHSFHRDGQMRVDGNRGGEIHTEPNSYGNWEDKQTKALPVEKGGDVYRYDFREDDHDYYTQVGLLYNAMTDRQKQVLYDNTARDLKDCTLQIKHRHINNCYQADPGYGEGVAKACGINIEDVDTNLPPRTSQAGNEEANRKHPELNEVHVVMPPMEEIDTNVDDPTVYTDPMQDPFVL